MTNLSTHIAAWGTTLTAITMAVCAFPVIAETAEQNKFAMQAEARAQALAAYEAAYEQGEQSETVSLWLENKVDGLQHVLNASTDAVPASLAMMDQTQCLAEAVYYEARSETKSGQRAVAEVILNRVDSKHFPDTVCGVVYEGSERQTGCQFSFTCDGSMDILPKGKSWKRSVEVAEFVMSGGHAPITNRATHYHTVAVSPIWSNNLRMTRRVGSHVFYRFAPRNYMPSEPIMLVAPPI